MRCSQDLCRYGLVEEILLSGLAVEEAEIALLRQKPSLREAMSTAVDNNAHVLVFRDASDRSYGRGYVNYESGGAHDTVGFYRFDLGHQWRVVLAQVLALSNRRYSCP